MGLSTTGETTVLTALLAGRYVSLHTADPGNTGASEISTGGGSAYARQAAVFAQTGNNPRSAKNNATVEFPVAATAWGTITHFGLWDAVAAGNFLGGAALTTSKAIAIDDVARFLTDQLIITAD